MHLFWFLVDTCVVNAYILQCESPNHRPTCSIGKKKDVYQLKLNFILQLPQQLVECHSSHKVVGRPPNLPPSESRFTNHVPCKYEKQRNYMYCSNKTTRKRTSHGCVECRLHCVCLNVMLHITLDKLQVSSLSNVYGRVDSWVG